MSEATFTLRRAKVNGRRVETCMDGRSWPTWEVVVNGAVVVGEIRPVRNELWTVIYDRHVVPNLTFMRSCCRDVKRQVMQPTLLLDTVKSDILANMADVLEYDRVMREEAELHHASLPPTDAQVYADLRDSDIEP